LTSHKEIIQPAWENSLEKFNHFLGIPLVLIVEVQTLCQAMHKQHAQFLNAPQQFTSRSNKTRAAEINN